MRRIGRRVGLGIGAALLLLVVAGGSLLAWQLTDDNLTRHLTQLLNENFAGRFEVDRVHYSLPANVEIAEVRALTPDGTRVARLGALHLRLLMMPLFRGKAIVDELALHELDLDVKLPANGATPPIAQALEPLFDIPPIDELYVPLRVEINHISIDEVNVTLRGKKNMHARVRDLEIGDASIWLQQDMLGANLTITAMAWMRSDDAAVKAPNIRMRLQEVRLKFSTIETWVKDMGVQLPGTEVHAKWYARASYEEGLQSAAVDTRIRIDTENPGLREQIPTIMRDALRGTALLHLTGQVRGEAANADLKLDQERLEVRGIPIKDLVAKVALSPERINLQGFKLTLGEGWLEAHGNVQLQPTAKILLGEHSLQLKAHALPVRGLVGQFIDYAGLLPQTLSCAVKAEGRALWPPTGQVDLDTVIEKFPGEDWPGLPRSAELKGRFLTHPDLLEILRLDIDVDKIPSFAIQGSLPMQPDSVLEILKSLHSPSPLGALHRIPAAPSTARPKN